MSSFEWESVFDPSEGVVVFTDGSAWTKDRSGGWSFIAVDMNYNLAKGSGGESDTTISRMELQAPTEALMWLYELYETCPLIAIYSDSEYVVMGITDRSRKRNKNMDCWERLEAAITLHEHIEFHHVKGHANHEYNELADKLAGEARRGRPA